MWCNKKEKIRGIRKKAQRNSRKVDYGYVRCSHQWLANGWAIGEPNTCMFTILASNPWMFTVLASGSPTGERLASPLHCCVFWPSSQHIKRQTWAISREARKTRKGTHLGHLWEFWRVWRILGFLGNQVWKLGEIWTSFICGCIFFSLLHLSSMNSFIVLRFVLISIMCY